MKYLFLHLFSKIDATSLSCDVYIYSKQHRVIFINLLSPSPLFIVIFGVPRVLPPLWGNNGLSSLLIIILVSHRPFSSLINMGFHQYFNNFTLLLRLSSTPKLIFFKVIMAMSSLIKPFVTFYLVEALFTKARVLIPSGGWKKKSSSPQGCTVDHAIYLTSIILMGDAIFTAAHLINWIPSCVVQLQTPFECLKESYPTTQLIPDVPFWVHCLCP